MIIFKLLNTLAIKKIDYFLNKNETIISTHKSVATIYNSISMCPWTSCLCVLYCRLFCDLIPSYILYKHSYVYVTEAVRKVNVIICV